MSGWGAVGGILTALFWIALLALIIWALVRLARGTAGRYREQQAETPQEILERRFARGEIDEDEYHRRRAGLAERHPGP